LFKKIGSFNEYKERPNGDKFKGEMGGEGSFKIMS